MKNCTSGKRSYASREIAEEALIEAHVQFTFGNAGGPVALYQCEDCGQFHLTSQGPVNERLAKLIKEGGLKRMREANQWTRRLNKP
ncbi:hypothetical protein QQ054_22685 [Oscillatoria amoena NRMC-F 0135]|nr:hypothetical protein [Oscillatoria amoena NRMC-F 0135]